MSDPIKCIRVVHIIDLDLRNYIIINALNRIMCKNYIIICRYGEKTHNYCDITIDDFSSIIDEEPLITIPLQAINSLTPRNT